MTFVIAFLVGILNGGAEDEGTGFRSSGNSGTSARLRFVLGEDGSNQSTDRVSAQAVSGRRSVVADVYTTESKYKAVFDTIPSFGRGYLLIDMIIFNDSSDTVNVTVSGFSVRTRSGAILLPIAAEQVAEQVLRSTTGGYFAGGVLAAGSSKGANDRIRADFAAKGLKDLAIPPGGRNQGFLFFANTELFQNLIIRGLWTANPAQVAEIVMPDIPLFNGLPD
jgi:hypothetical protein